MIRTGYHNRRFVPAENDKSDRGTAFHYREKGYRGDIRGGRYYSVC